jgi:hypothetical protein
MKSEIKIGQQFEFVIRADKELSQKAVVTRVLSNREEGLGPEVDYYMADWIEARTLSEPPKALVFVPANDPQRSIGSGDSTFNAIEALTCCQIFVGIYTQ